MLPELLEVRVRTDRGTIGTICGYKKGRRTSLILLGFSEKQEKAWPSSAIEDEDIILKEYPRYLYSTDYEVIEKLLKRRIIK